MKKEAYYFSHDGNAQDDPKCMLLIDQLGMEGYGIFWALIEKLRSERSYMLPLSVCNAFAKRWGTSKEKVEAVINGYGLFKIQKNYFFSVRLKQSMAKKTELARHSALIRWKDTKALPMQSESNATGMRNDAIKVKESKVKEKKKGNTDFSVEKKNTDEEIQYSVDKITGKKIRLLTKTEREKAEWEFNNPNGGIQPE